MGLLDHVEASRSVLGGVAVRIERVADEGAVGLAFLVLDLGEGQDLIDDPGQFEPGLRALDLGHVDLAVEVIELLVEHADEDDVLGAGVLEVHEPGDHLAAVQAISASQVRLAGLVGDGLGLPAAPLEAEAARNGDGVDEHRFVAIEHTGVAELLADRVVMRLAVGLLGAERRVRPADEGGEVPAFLPCARADRVDGEVANREVARLQVEEQRGAAHQGPEQPGLARAGLAEDGGLDAAMLGKALLGRDDGKAPHHERTSGSGEPSSRSKNNVMSGGSAGSSEVLPAPLLPKIATLMLRRSESRWPAEMMGSLPFMPAPHRSAQHRLHCRSQPCRAHPGDWPRQGIPGPCAA